MYWDSSLVVRNGEKKIIVQRSVFTYKTNDKIHLMFYTDVLYILQNRVHPVHCQISHLLIIIQSGPKIQDLAKKILSKMVI